jgi:hypothetical protein
MPGSVKTSGPNIWRYKDARGVEHRGHVENVYDYGGTDISYGMRSSKGEYHMLSGSRLKEARVEYPPEPDYSGGDLHTELTR